jgi:hypothetical protein
MQTGLDERLSRFHLDDKPAACPSARKRDDRRRWITPFCLEGACRLQLVRVHPDLPEKWLGLNPPIRTLY